MPRHDAGRPGGRPATAETTRSWTGHELLRTNAHQVVLSDDLVARLRRRLPDVFEPPTPATLPAFRSDMAQSVGDIAQAVGQRLGPGGPGIAVVTHDDLETLSDGQLTTLTFGVSVLLGKPALQPSPEDFIVPVEDQKPADVTTTPGYKSNGRMGMHNDPTDAAVLACLAASAQGGENLFVSAAAVHDALAREAPAVLEGFRRPWTWDLRGAQRPGSEPLVDSPVFSHDPDDVKCRFGWLLLREGARARGRLTPDVDVALALFEEVARRPELTLRHRLRRGQSVWLDNYRVLHAREAFEDGADTTAVRRLIRIWLWLHERAPLPQSFSAFSAAIHRGALG
ncbi:TauD/TfdA family dioxygenase [Streptomyces scopuliridis]|uniref:TauD/TfdA family dioxygenase n=1 Tax=Streptomyces scopuliridis TaxID=452529 RepID=UPI00368FDC65